MSQEPCCWSQLQLHERLGEGASGVTHRATLHSGGGGGGAAVAVKVFKSGSVTSDGLPQSEVAAWTLAGAHESIIPVLRSVADVPGGAHALLMPVVDKAFAAVAQPPSMDSCTRDVYVAAFFPQ